MKKNTFNAVMLWFSEEEMGISNNRDIFRCVRIVKFEDPHMALDYYANTPCPASQLINADSQEELDAKIQEMYERFDHDDDWHKYLREVL